MTAANEARSTIFTTKMDHWSDSVKRLMESSGIAEELNSAGTILIKPNLVEALEPPITTPVELIEALIINLQSIAPQTIVVVGEGTGSLEYTTEHCFEKLGYVEMAMRQGIELIDLNTVPLTRKTLPSCIRWPEMYLPQMLDEVFILSVPVLKAHTLAKVTLTLKNMMGCAPPAHYQEGGSWGKSAFHRQIDSAVLDLNRYRTPDFTLLDATVGMAEAHLWGKHCDPPVGRLCVSRDPVAIDSYGCQLLGKPWQSVGYIEGAHEELGIAEPLTIVEV